MNIYDQFDAAFRYAKSDRRRFYPGSNHLRRFDDPRLGELLADYHATKSDESHNRLLGYLRKSQPLVDHFLDYLDRVGGPLHKPQISSVASRLVRNPTTQQLEEERGAVSLDHRRLRGESQPFGEKASGPATIHLTVTQKHAGQLFVYRLAVPNFHVEQLGRDRTPAQREVTERLAEKRSVS